MTGIFVQVLINQVDVGNSFKKVLRTIFTCAWSKQNENYQCVILYAFEMCWWTNQLVFFWSNIFSLGKKLASPYILEEYTETIYGWMPHIPCGMCVFFSELLSDNLFS